LSGVLLLALLGGGAAAQVVQQPFGGGVIPQAPQQSSVGSVYAPPPPVVAPAGTNRQSVTTGEHMSQCLSRHPSYDPKTNTYTGPDGQPHICR
jgi:hypothetical protein